ncbi:hypothetical protein CLV71_10811 [Actinophytocola oryzae]|uniref:Uncharacterized protein n=1 Tax=Actinophytocola oryzae TaxID=502181 RepID=A0A4V3FST4_9PSEU|nr:hypothetical protein CLV71_10811 [Actinophytocola oryzae]
MAVSVTTDATAIAAVRQPSQSMTAPVSALPTALPSTMRVTDQSSGVAALAAPEARMALVVSIANGAHITPSGIAATAAVARPPGRQASTRKPPAAPSVRGATPPTSPNRARMP